MRESRPSGSVRALGRRLPRSTRLRSGATEIIEDCGLARDPDVHCSVVGHWWLDLDDPANAALVNAPITVTLTGGHYLGSAQVGRPVDVSLRIRLEEK